MTRTLERLFRVLNLEEEQAQAEFETALRKLHHWERCQKAANERERRGRELMAASAADSDQTLDRIAALQETAAGSRAASHLQDRIEAMQQEVAGRREQFLAKRVEKRQAEALLREAQKSEVEERDRQTQQATDDWYLRRLHKKS